MQPPNKQLLQNLCGPLDENLRHIEAHFNVAIARRGGQLHISGNAEFSAFAAELLQKLYAQATEPLSISGLQRNLIEMNRGPQESTDQAIESTDIEPTRAKAPHGHTPN